ncbi:MAG TPA: hypothetical protein VGB42_11110, partial [Candidatus Thermoplasmatota archaeon]
MHRFVCVAADPTYPLGPDLPRRVPGRPGHEFAGPGTDLGGPSPPRPGRGADRALSGTHISGTGHAGNSQAGIDHPATGRLGTDSTAIVPLAADHPAADLAAEIQVPATDSARPGRKTRDSRRGAARRKGPEAASQGRTARRALDARRTNRQASLQGADAPSPRPKRRINTSSKGTQIELLAIKVLEAEGFVVHRAVRTGQKRGPLWISQSNDIFGCIDLVAKRRGQRTRWIQVTADGGVGRKKRELLEVPWDLVHDSVEIWRWVGGAPRKHRTTGVLLDRQFFQLYHFDDDFVLDRARRVPLRVPDWEA